MSDLKIVNYTLDVFWLYITKRAYASLVRFKLFLPAE